MKKKPGDNLYFVYFLHRAGLTMELSCESVRNPEETRPTSSKFVELHVLYVPGDQWNVKLNKIPAKAIESFISAGFIRVFPDITLQALRPELGAFLSIDRSINKFSFLKCVGRSLALVRSQQERDLKVKTFAPPYAPQPELYLLPSVDSHGDLYYRPVTSETGSSSPDHHTHRSGIRKWILPGETKELVKFPHIAQCSQRSPPTPSLEEEEEEEEEGDDQQQSFSSSGTDGGNEDEAPSSDKFQWEEKEECLRKSHDQRAAQAPSQIKAVSVTGKSPPREGESCRKKKPHSRQSRAARDSGVAESSEDRDSGFSLTDRLGKSQDAHTFRASMSKAASGVTESPAVLSQPSRCANPPPVPETAAAVRKAVGSTVFNTNREELMEEIKLMREERRRLEWKRQELLRKGKDLLAQNRHRRNQARDSWKKKYFDTKKATAPLEDTLRNLRQELETFYNKLLYQLHARDSRGKPRRQGQSSIKNELIIQIMTESYEIDNLKRKVEDAKMKLVTEIKLRKQAATELRALKAELAQKKSQSVGSWDGPRLQNSST